MMCKYRSDDKGFLLTFN
uniref:Uncharacterized protein n=1 Tax=Arundo donax TaxID=35708 RepID=A0A0A9CXA2_ARUDO